MNFGKLSEEVPAISRDDLQEGSNQTIAFTGEMSSSLPHTSSQGSRMVAKSPDKLLYHCLPITCLKLLDGVVIVASEGPSILTKMAYFEEHSFQRFQLFPSQFMIAGMEFVEYPSLECGDNPGIWHKKSDKSYDHIYVGFVWAGSLGTVVRLTRKMNKELELLECVEGCCENELINFDFIPIAAKWLEKGKILALLSVLNYLVIFERTEKTGSGGNFTNFSEVKRIKCGKSETLFSGTISGTTRDQIRIFAGTVFNGICIWDVCGDKEGVIKHELTCHDGIIFSLQYYANRKLLLSTSDDRTVASWKFSEDKDSENVTLIRRFYGHDARVWKAINIHDYVISVGESSDVRVNILKDGAEHKVWKAHNGAPIFTCAYDEDFEILYTGGNEGTILKWPKWWYRIKPRILPYDTVPPDPEVGEKVEVLSTGRWSENKDYPKTATLLDINHVLVSMESGRVMGLTWEGKQFDLLYDERCEGFQIIKASPDQKTLAVAGNNGHFYLAQISFSENQSSKTTVLHAKKIFMTKISWNIMSMIWLDVSRLLIICFNRAVALLCQEDEQGERSNVQFIQTFDLDLQRPGIPTAVEIYGKYIVLGDELGSLHVLRYHKATVPIKKLDKAHKDGVTNLLFHDSKLYTSGRDGLVRTFNFKVDSENDMEVDFVPVSSFRMTFDWITGMYTNMGQMLICGFHKEDFVVHSFNEMRTLAKIPCGGGGNRKWDFKYGHGTSGSKNASFTFIREKEILYTFLPMEGYLNVTLKEGLHTRTINCAIHLQSNTSKECISYLTCSEDGSLKWFEWHTSLEKISTIKNMENHVSSVRCAWKFTDVADQMLIFSGGGRSQLCIFKIDYANETVDVLKEIILVKTSCKQTEGDVRIMDITVMQAFNDDSNELMCFGACSDGYVRVLYFNVQTLKFKIVGLLKGNSHSVMKIQILESDHKQVCICGVTSNGCLVIWNWNHDEQLHDFSSNSKQSSLPEKEPLFTKLLRRTAFLSMKIFCGQTNQQSNFKRAYYIACGGDDCSVSLWLLQVQENEGSSLFEINEKWSEDQLQRGAVVGVDIDNNTIYTLSNDQIVGFWSWDGKLRNKVYAGVSDCQGFVVDCANRSIMCFGKGVSWIPIPNEFS